MCCVYEHNKIWYSIDSMEYGVRCVWCVRYVVGSGIMHAAKAT